MRPSTAIGVLKRRTKLICSEGPPPEKRSSPVSPWNAWSRLLDSEPTVHTTGSELPSGLVTIGEPRPWLLAHHATLIVGGASAPILSATRLPDGPGQPTPCPLVTKTTYVPVAVV